MRIIITNIFPIVYNDIHRGAEMFICVCKAIREREVREQVEAGAGSFREVREALDIGTCCGRCVPDTRELIDDTLRQIAARLGVAA